MKIHCRTNIDLRPEQWPTEVEARPQVGDIIESKTAWGPRKIHLELAVVGVKYKYYEGWEKTNESFSTPMKSWQLEIELHLPPYYHENFTQFQQWYKDILR